MQKYFELFEVLFSPSDEKIKILDPLCREGDVLLSLKELFPNAICYGVEKNKVLGENALKRLDHFYASSPLDMKKGRKCFDIAFINAPSEMAVCRDGIDHLNRICIKEWMDSVSIGGYLIVQINASLDEKKFFKFLETSDFENIRSIKHTLGTFYVFRRLENLAGKDFKISPPTDFSSISCEKMEVKARGVKTNTLFFPKNGIEGWQLVAMAESCNAGSTIRKLIFPKNDEQKDLAIDTPNDGQAIMLMSLGLLNEKIANRYIIKGGIKRQVVKKMRDNGEGIASDVFSSRIYAFDCEVGKYLLLE